MYFPISFSVGWEGVFSVSLGKNVVFFLDESLHIWYNRHQQITKNTYESSNLSTRKYPQGTPKKISRSVRYRYTISDKTASRCGRPDRRCRASSRVYSEWASRARSSVRTPSHSHRIKMNTFRVQYARKILFHRRFVFCQKMPSKW